MKPKILWSILILSLALLILFFWIFPTNKAERFFPSGVNSHFSCPSLTFCPKGLYFDRSKSFSEYVLFVHQHILEKGRIFRPTDLPYKDKIINWNTPFILKPPSTCVSQSIQGALLIHGLNNSPFEMRTLGENLQAHCFIVYGLLLTGHGTRPGDLLEVTYQDWTQQVEYAVNELKKHTARVYLGGFSTGGTLALLYGLQHPKDISGLILLAPAVSLPRLAMLTPFLSKFKPWLHQYLDETPKRYESFTTNGAAQVYLLTKKIQKYLKDNVNTLKNIKTFLAFSYEDATIDAPASINLMLRHTSPALRKLIIYHQADIQIPLEISNEKNIISVNSTIPSQKILDMSHLSIPISYNNAFIDTHEVYRNCLHYALHSQQYQKCKTSPEVYYGEITYKNLHMQDTHHKTISLVRLGYNPFLDDFKVNGKIRKGLLSEIDDFFGLSTQF